MSGETTEQLAVVHHNGGHALVGAVAGSGKTRTLISRIVYRLQNGLDFRRALVLMFNRAAREDFEKRLKSACRDKALRPPRVRTFHAFGLDLCKALQEHGLIPPARLLDKDWELRKIARDVLDQVNPKLDELERFETNDQEVITAFIGEIETIKNTLLLNNDEEFQKLPTKWRLAFNTFESRRTEGANKFRTFTDLIYDPVMAIRTNPDVAKFVSNHYDEILVDEFQDTCDLQVALLVAVAGTRAHVIAVGDEDQTIYGFRNARPDYMIHKFEQLFPNTTRYTLSATFRYGHAVALLANHCIRHNTQRTDKMCVSATQHQTELSLLLVKDDIGPQVIKALNDWTAQGRSLGECAILVREYSHTIISETAMVRNNIPYRLVGAPPFFERKEVLALRAAVITACQLWDTVESEERKRALLAALMTVPPLFLKRDMQEAIIQQALGATDPVDVLYQAIDVHRSHVKGYAANRFRLFCAHIDACYKAGPKANAADFLDAIIDRLDLATVFARNESSPAIAREKMHLLMEFVNLARRHQGSLENFSDFLEDLAARVGNAGEGEAVLVTSIHRSKGLEFPHVIIPELSDERFPSVKDSTEEIEDERRLFYVGVTRAQERLTLLAPYDPLLLQWYTHAIPEQPDPERIKASRFLYEAHGKLASDAARAILAGTEAHTCCAGVDPSGIHSRYLQRYDKQRTSLQDILSAPDDSGPDVVNILD